MSQEGSIPSDAGEGASLAASWLDEHGDVLFRYALARVGRSDVAEDLVQDTLVAAIEGWKGFRGGSAVRTWLVGILRHKVMDHARRRAREASWREQVQQEAGAANPEFHDGYWGARPSEWSDTPSGPEAEELRRLLTACLGELPEPMRLAVTLREIDGVPSKMVCEVLGVTPTNLWTLVHRAKLRLRKDLGEKWFDRASSESS